jgi:hypothetical protein
MKTAAILLTFASLPGVVTAQKPPTLKQQIASEVGGRTFTTKIVLRSMLSSARSNIPGAWTYVATNVLANGQVVYGLSNLFMVDRGGSIPRPSTCGPSPSDSWSGITFEGTLCWVAAGQSVTVRDVNLAGDNLSLTYWPPGRAADYTVPWPALSFIFGKDWQKSMTFDAVMEAIGDALVIERIERARVVTKEYSDLRQQQEQLSAPPQADSLDKQLEVAQHLRDVLNSLIANRAEYERLGKGSAPQELAQYSSRLRELDAEIPRLRVEIKQHRTDTIVTTLSTAESGAAGFRSALASVPKSGDELKTAQDILLRWESNLRSREELAQALSSLDGNLAASHVASSQAEREEIGKRRADLAALEPKLQLSDLNAAYARMKMEENRLRAAYVAAFDTPRQRDAAAAFRNHVQTMIANREAAQRLGETTLAAEIQRLRSQLATIR